ncbi:glycosyl transferase [Pseudoalteromonas haloplanktis]|uniref:Glycosyl transferase n=1 Tax=Pseudoalteromonas haloplanktis TaxID=228 RepID=A0ABU1BK35_PSEHA|nr:glycosyl transferase [Pseudoalteromonas haloplanktis]MDQ9094141.1 glycosyl transferase [Pseudoalteromonas haloplanktis]
MLNKLIKFIKKTHYLNSNFEYLQNLNYRVNHFLNKAMNSKDMLTIQREPSSSELIVSLTTYAGRIHDVHLVIESLGEQTIKANRLILWLDEEEFTLDTIPLILKSQLARGLEIRFCPNYRSYKKLIPTMEEFPSSNIITVDDDILYPFDMIEALCNEHVRNPNCIIGHRAHLMTFDRQSYNLKKYIEWEHETKFSEASDNIFITSGGGTFFPAYCFNKNALQSELFLKLAPHADDIWFKAMSILNDMKHKKVDDDRAFASRFLYLKSSQSNALAEYNVFVNGNDTQLKNVVEHYHLKIKPD